MEMKLAPRAVRRPAQRAFARHPGPARKAIRRRADLAKQVKMTVQGAGIGLDLDDRPWLQAELRGGARPRGLVLEIAPTASGDQPPAE
jgi:hypothetical protein